MTRRLQRGLIALCGCALLLTAVGLAANSEPLLVAGEPNSNRGSIERVDGELTASENFAGQNNPDIAARDIEPIRLPRWLVIGVAVLAGIGLLYVLSLQRFVVRRRRGRAVAASHALTDDEEAEAIVEFTRDLIDELRDGDDPRQAIQRAYAAVETGFGVIELTRKPAETPLAYLSRILGRDQDVSEPLATLTDLFQVARFSDEPVTELMRTEAIEAVGQIRSRYERRLVPGARSR